MFNKLRNRFLLMNMIIISIIMLVAFAAIYTITYRDVRRDIALDLERVSETYRKPDAGDGLPRRGGTIPFRRRAAASWSPRRNDRSRSPCKRTRIGT
ncbi:hypothetical protein [Cohnella algarum]|uniref:hypothetical protein n=1 Tax=Cohnella algarum TaxID=2044859 RepID=UPI001F088447|nr:hypothetical protein [Cohnella algarum]